MANTCDAVLAKRHRGKVGGEVSLSGLAGRPWVYKYHLLGHLWNIAWLVISGTFLLRRAVGCCGKILVEERNQIGIARAPRSVWSKRICINSISSIFQRIGVLVDIYPLESTDCTGCAFDKMRSS